MRCQSHPSDRSFQMAELSPLRRRMIEDMTVRNLSPATQRSYVSAVSKFSRYFGRSPDKLTLDDVHAFQVHLVSTGISWPRAEPNRLRPAFLLWHHARPGDGSRADPVRAGAAQTAGCAERR